MTQNIDIRSRSDEPSVPFNARKAKPGRDFFAGNFFTLLLISFYILFFFKNITGYVSSSQAGGGGAVSLQLNHFTSHQVLSLFGLFLLMLVERMLYRSRKYNWQHQEGTDHNEDEFTKHALSVKLGIYVVLVVMIHFLLGFYLPIKQGTTLHQHTALWIFYLMWVAHFLYAGLQIKYGYPQAPYKQTFMRDTSDFKVNLFRLYKGIPFLWEMKVIIDWTVTNTCLDLF